MQPLDTGPQLRKRGGVNALAEIFTPKIFHYYLFYIFCVFVPQSYMFASP